MSAVMPLDTTPQSYPAPRTVAVAHGDGIGPEIMDAVLHVLREAGCPVDWAPVYWIHGILWLFAKMCFFFFCLGWVKATVPRYRSDPLMRLGWPSAPTAPAMPPACRPRPGRRSAPTASCSRGR